MSEPVKDSIAGQIAGRITGSELEVMKLLWRAEDALPITEIREIEPLIKQIFSKNTRQ